MTVRTEISPPPPLNREFVSRQEADRERARVWNEAATVGIRDLKGHGPTRKMKRQCDRCGAMTFYYLADTPEALSRPGTFTPCDSCVFADAMAEEDTLPLVSSFARMQAELRRFENQWPNVFAALRTQLTKALGQHEADSAFLGARTKTRQSTFGDDMWLSLLSRHGSGDWGEFGTADGLSLSEDERFAPERSSIRARNALALEAGRGLIRSRYLVPPEMQDHLGENDFCRDHVNPGACLARLDVFTLIGRQTHCRVGRVGEQCAGASDPR